MTVITALGDVTNMAMSRLKAVGAGAKRKRPEEIVSQPTVVLTAFEEQLLPCDREHVDDELYCVEYQHSISNELRKGETKYLPNADYLASQSDVSTAMRATLLDWLIEVHLKFKLRQETLYLTVLLIDRYLDQVEISRRKLQCVGIVAMLVAAKYEEIYPPEIIDFCQITDNAYTRDEVLEMEIDMLNRLEFCLTQPTSLMFLQRYLAVDGADPGDLRFKIAQFLLELTLTETFALKYAPSNMAAAALYLSNRLFEVSSLRTSPSWSAPIEEYTKYDEKMLRPCTKEMLGVLCNLRDKNSTVKAVYRKYDKADCGVINSVPIQKVLRG